MINCARFFISHQRSDAGDPLTVDGKRLRFPLFRSTYVADRCGLAAANPERPVAVSREIGSTHTNRKSELFTE